MVKHILKGGLVSLCVLFTNCGSAMNNKATTFDWHATECAPKHYPMKIIQGTFHYKGQKDGLYIPSGGVLSAGWGEAISFHITGEKLKPLPDRVSAVFYSYAEKQFYAGDFDLPYERILAMFREDHKKSIPDRDLNSIMLGVAPGGAVSVWVAGAFATEIFAGQAEKIDLGPTGGFPVPLNSKAEADAYKDKILTMALSSEELESLKKNGIPFGLWQRYRHLYKWAPSYKNDQTPTDKTMPVDFLNGESYFMPTVFTAEQENVPRPIPRALKFSAPAGGKSHYYIIQFDEFELMDAFEKLGSNGEKVYIEFEPQAPRENMKIRVYNDVEPKSPKDIKEHIELKKFYIQPKD